MKRTYRSFTRLAFSCLLAVALNPLCNLPAQAQAQVIHDHEVFALNFVDFSACSGEFIHFTGAVIFRSTTTIDAQGILHVRFTANDASVRGIGMTSGTIYRRVGATHQSIREDGGAPVNGTFTNSYSFIGQGQTANQILVENGHFTVNAQGQLTVDFVNSRLTCR
jgi:hypothetical protein